MPDAIPDSSPDALRHPHRYMLYGLHIHSNEPLPLLPAPAQSPAQTLVPTQDQARHLTITFNPPCARPNLQEATITYGYPFTNLRGESLIQVYLLDSEDDPPADPLADPCDNRASRAGKRYCFHTSFGAYWADCVLAADGTSLQAFGSAHAPAADLIPYVLGGVVPALLRLQGVTCLHASAVLLNGAVVAFTGDSETGKSTTMAALLQRGSHFFSDDLLPLATHNPASDSPESNHVTMRTFAQGDDPEAVRAYPGYPRLGLMEDAMTALFGVEADLPLLARTNKRVYTPNMSQAGFQPWPLAAVYILGPRGSDPALTQPRIVPLSQQAAVAALMPHTTGRTLRTPAGHVDDLTRIAKLARTVPVRRVDRPDDLRQLDEVAQAIYDDVCALTAANLPKTNLSKIGSPEAGSPSGTGAYKLAKARP